MRLFRRSKSKARAAAEAQQQRSGYAYIDEPLPAGRATNTYPSDGRNAAAKGYSNYYGGNNVRFAPWLELPTPLLERIFALVCPHCRDESYETCEQSALEDACMLCDLRDLAHAGQVCRRWRKTAVQMMYHSIRIDSVHYCDLEIVLAEKRKRRSRFDRNGVPEDTASARLHLLCRTLREDPTRLGKPVQFLKTPYMLRESSANELARTIAVLPNLKYVDLPEGIFVDDPHYQTLRLEVQARCPDIRKITYNGGSERSLEQLGHGIVWRNLEVLELGKINMDPAVLRHVLAGLEHLRALKINESKIVDDDIFMHNDVLAPFPPLEELILNQTPRVTASGLAAYVSRPDTQKSLKVLSLTDTGVRPQTLQQVLAYAHNLKALSIIEEVETALPPITSPLPPLASSSLQTLRWEITASSASNSYAGMTNGYYSYLASSLLAGGLPRLTALYVRDQNFPDLLLGLPPPAPGFAAGSPIRPSSSSSSNAGGFFASPGSANLSPVSTGGRSSSTTSNGFMPSAAPPRFSSNNPFARAGGGGGGNLGSLGGMGMLLSLAQTLEVFTKGEDDMEWGIVKMDPSRDYAASGWGGGGSGHHRGRSGGSSGAGARPLSSYGLADVGAGWSAGGGARKSIMVGNGAGGFLAVPSDDGPRVRRASGQSESGGAGRFGRTLDSRGSGSGSGSARDRDEWPRPKSRDARKGDRDLWR